MTGDLLTRVEPPITAADMVEELNREIGMRQRVYPVLVDKKRMTQGEADRRVAILRAAMNWIIGAAKS